MEELIKVFGERYASLTDDEKEIVRGLQGTAEGRVLAKILGPRYYGFNKIKKTYKDCCKTWFRYTINT